MAATPSDSFTQIKDGDWDNLNRALRYIYAQLNAITGNSGANANTSRAYTPVFTNLVNVGSTLQHETNFLRILNTVIVFGSLSAQPKSAGIVTGFRMSLPIPAKFVNEWEAGGVAACPGIQESAAILASTTDQTVGFSWVPSDTAFRRLSFVFVYPVP